MSSLSFPDINVWLALASSEHVLHIPASEWWDRESGLIAFSRFTQIGFLRLTTTAAAMSGKPLTMQQAWRTYDRFFEDDRVDLFQSRRTWKLLFENWHPAGLPRLSFGVTRG